MEFEAGGKRVKYPGLGLLIALALFTSAVGMTLFFRRQGGREVECGSDCAVSISGPVPASAFVTVGIVLALSILAMVALVVTVRREQVDRRTLSADDR